MESTVPFEIEKHGFFPRLMIVASFNHYSGRRTFR